MALFVTAMINDETGGILNQCEGELMKTRPLLVRELYEIDTLMEGVMPGHGNRFDYGQSRMGRKVDFVAAAAALDSSIAERLSLRDLVRRFCEYSHDHDGYCEDRLRNSMKRLEKKIAKYLGDDWKQVTAELLVQRGP